MRYIEAHVQRDLARKMVFIGGPRQSGKTTLAKQLLTHYGEAGLYLNWDDSLHQKKILGRAWQQSDRLIAFDELHKYGRWKNWLKGVYDTRPDGQNFLVTGSARLDVYRRGGDSMLGRYHYWRLHPFCLAELPAGMSAKDGLERLMRVGGFPEPFLDGDAQFARRWRRERRLQVFREDIRDLEHLRDLSAVNLLMDLLQTRVGGQVVINNLVGDLQVAHKTIAHWIEVLERMYLIFTVYPYHDKIARALAKPPKIYFFDNMDVEGDVGSVFENLVATHLLKRLHFLEDSTGHRYDLRYIRDREKREVDFVILKDNQVDALIEVKWQDERPSTSLAYYAARLKPRRVLHIVGTLQRSHDRSGVHYCSPVDSLSRLDCDL